MCTNGPREPSDRRLCPALRGALRLGQGQQSFIRERVAVQVLAQLVHPFGVVERLFAVAGGDGDRQRLQQDQHGRLAGERAGAVSTTATSSRNASPSVSVSRITGTPVAVQ